MEERVNKTGIDSITQFSYTGKTVILRLDLNAPVDPATGKLRNHNRILKSVPTLRYLLDQSAKLVVLSHQGDSQDYKSLIPLREHAEVLSREMGRTVAYLEDVCGPAAQEAVKALKPGEAVLLGNLRYLSEEITAFEFTQKVTPEWFLNCFLLRSLVPLADEYVNDAFSAAHRTSPSLTTFQEVLPSAAGLLLFNEVEALTRVLEHPEQPAVFLLGGNRITDAYGMMEAVLSRGTAQSILTCGVTALTMLWAKGVDLGTNAKEHIRKYNYEPYVEEAKELLARFGDKIRIPADLAIAENGQRKEIPVSALPLDADLFDIGSETIAAYKKEIENAGTVFVNGPPGVYENPCFEKGTKELFLALQNTRAYTVVGGGDSVTAATKYTDTSRLNYVCTGGGAMVQFLSGQELPLITAMKKACVRRREGKI